MPVQNAEVAAMFDQAAETPRNRGGESISRSGVPAGRPVIGGLPQSVKGMLKAGKDLSELPGIGKDLGPRS